MGDCYDDAKKYTWNWKQPLTSPYIKGGIVKGTNELIEERESTHGDFTKKAAFIQVFKTEVRRGGAVISHSQLEALDNIIQKIGRIVYGDANCQDHWDDIAGYAKLANMKK